MQQVVNTGAFTQQTVDILNGNFASLAVDWYVNPQTGSDAGNYDGKTAETAFQTFAYLEGFLEPGDVVQLIGVCREQWITPLGLNDITITGLPFSRPRQATTGGVPNGGGSTWLSPSSGIDNTLPLIRVRGQGWTLANIYFNNSATSNGCVQPFTDGAGDPPVDADGAHLQIINCILTGAAYGVYASGGTNFVSILNSTLFGFSGAGDAAIAQTVGAGVGTLLGWRVIGCRIYGNASNIVMPFNQAVISECQINNGTAANINLTGGTAPNFVLGNAFNIAAADFDPAGGTTGVTGDVWSNTLTDAIETGIPTN